METDVHKEFPDIIENNLSQNTKGLKFIPKTKEAIAVNPKFLLWNRVLQNVLVALE